MTTLIEELIETLRDVECSNCKGSICMACVLREYHKDCEEDCPFCCNKQNPWGLKREKVLERAWKEYEADRY
ncbi:MAG TPA: hypothetical protein ENI23_04140 [bacterium]|nr:hypothetical protein [bacterium]